MALPHNVKNIANILSQCPENLLVTVFVSKGRNDSDSSYFLVFSFEKSKWYTYLAYGK